MQGHGALLLEKVPPLPPLHHHTITQLWLWLWTVSPQHVMMKVYVCVALLISSIGLTEALFIPEELPTLLSFLYTNIPPIFKGTDSRVGVGFRVGPNADFQMQFELGPQTQTQAVGPDAEGTNKKRQVDEPPLDDFMVPTKKKKKKRKKTPRPDTPQGWLHSWKATVDTLPQGVEGMGEDYQGHISQPVVDYETVMHLQQLYKEQVSQMNEEATTDDVMIVAETNRRQYYLG